MLQVEGGAHSTRLTYLILPLNTNQKQLTCLYEIVKVVLQ